MLVRWKKVDGSFVFFEVFIFFVERIDLIFFFGEWFIVEVCSVIEKFKVVSFDICLVINIFGR